MPVYKNALERFEKHCMPEPMSGCLLWIGALYGTGYAQFWYQGKLIRGHRWYWEYFHGPIPSGLELDHICRVRSCVNLHHLQAVPKYVNMSRGFGPTAINKRKTHCLRGHEYTPENTYFRSARYGHRAGNRECKACWNIRSHSVGTHTVPPKLPAPTSSIPPKIVMS